VAVRYASWTGERQRLLDPLGLVLKAGAWYLVALAAGAKAPRTYRLASVQTLALREEACQRPPDFDLPRFWRDSSARFEAGLRRFSVRLRATPARPQPPAQCPPAARAAGGRQPAARL
jgi:predicted DNA-binding transcriptional regulator YafY